MQERKTAMKKKKENLPGKLGITQEMMASYLGISRSALTMYQHSERSLPTAVIGKHSALEDALFSNEQPASLASFASTERALVREAMDAHISTCNMKLMGAKRRLEKLRNDFDRTMNALKVSGILLANLPTGKAGKQDRMWLELLEAEAWKQIDQCGQAAQAKLELQMEVLAFEIAAAKRRMDA